MFLTGKSVLLRLTGWYVLCCDFRIHHRYLGPTSAPARPERGDVRSPHAIVHNTNNTTKGTPSTDGHNQLETGAEKRIRTHGIINRCPLPFLAGV